MINKIMINKKISPFIKGVSIVLSKMIEKLPDENKLTPKGKKELVRFLNILKSDKLKSDKRKIRKLINYGKTNDK